MVGEGVLDDQQGGDDDVLVDPDRGDGSAGAVLLLDRKVPEHAHLSACGLARIHDPHIVVGKLHLVQLRVVLPNSLPHGGVQGVHWTIPIRDVVLHEAVHPELDDGMGVGAPVAGTPVWPIHGPGHSAAVAVQLPILNGLSVEHLMDQKFEGCLGGLKLVALILKLRDARHNTCLELLVQATELLAKEGVHIAVPRQLTHEDAPLVAHKVGVNVLIAVRDLRHGMDVHATLVGEGCRPHEGLPGVGDCVGQLVQCLAEGCQLGNSIFRKTVVAHLQPKVADDRRQIHISTPFAEAIDRPLHLIAASLDGRQCVGHCQSPVIVDVDPELDVSPQGLLQCVDVLDDLGGQRATVCVTQDEPGGPCVHGSLQSLNGVLWIGTIAIEEVLSVIEDVVNLPIKEADGVPDHVKVLLQRALDNRFHVEIPCLAHDGHCRGLALQESFHPFIILRRHPLPRCHTKRGHLGFPQIQLPYLLEELLILRIG
mmetsp:Transcript_91823/g.159271  ORF Transcript_91823/g.159271 Transcript_91823/m.159271 type:complete len:482 (+) Transcript_91823:932-2377(+)